MSIKDMYSQRRGHSDWRPRFDRSIVARSRQARRHVNDPVPAGQSWTHGPALARFVDVYRYAFSFTGAINRFVLRRPSAPSSSHSAVVPLQNEEVFYELSDLDSDSQNLDTITKDANDVLVERSNNDADLEDDTNDNEVVVSIRKLLLDSNTSLSSNSCCIYGSPIGVRVFNEAAYMPKLICIGPQHLHLKGETTWVNELKIIYSKKFIERTSNKSLNSIIKKLEDLKESVYKCYENNDWDYLKVTLFHGCFIVEHMIRSHCHELREEIDNIPLMERRRNQIKRDLLLMDNQIPYFLLKSLYDLIPHSFPPLHFRDLVMSFFKEYKRDDMVLDFSSVKHFTDLIRTLHKPTIRRSQEQSYPHFEYTLSATQLCNSGVEFKMVPGNCLLDINFRNGVLEFPCFELNDNQESLFRNLIAFELCHYPGDTFIIDYFVFIDALIDTSEDISLLIQAGVLVNRIGDHSDAANTFNKFCAGITHYRADKSYLRPILWQLNEHYKKPTHTQMTTFKRDYCGTPLQIASTIAAVLLVLLTFISTVCSIISVL